jgi:hypothetical protein
VQRKVLASLSRLAPYAQATGAGAVLQHAF